VFQHAILMDGVLKHALRETLDLDGDGVLHTPYERPSTH
jgi:hypothetical protein